MESKGVKSFDEHELIHDWNQVLLGERPLRQGCGFVDETLRDGLQNPSVVNPPVEGKIELLHCMDAIGVHAASVGLPASSPRVFDETVRLCREIRDAKLRVTPTAAGRTRLDDVEPILEAAQRAGVQVEAYLFIASSPIRGLVQAWDIESVGRRAASAIEAVTRAGLPVAFVLEDTTRTQPEALRVLYRMAVDHGVQRICLADTVGHAVPLGVEALMRFTQQVLSELGAPDLPLDWHGHNDRGLGLANALRAVRCGADRVHGTALGVGERVGNAPLELILVNLKLLGLLPDQDLSALPRYCETASRILRWQVPVNYPVFGRDAFRTATGVHASAILKAQALGAQPLADRVYSGVPAGMFGREQCIEVGFMSGASNARHWLRERGYAPSEALVQAVLAVAKAADHVLTEEEVEAVVRAHGAVRQ